MIYAYIQKMLFTELYDKSSHSDEDDELSQMQDIEGAKAENVDQSKDENIDKEIENIENIHENCTQKMYFDGNGTIFEEYEPNFNFATKGHGQIPSDGPTFGATN